jgi:hypothetical protein
VEAVRRSVDDANIAAITASHGIEAVVAAMKRHTDAAGVQEYGCGMLWSLAINDANRAAVAVAGGGGSDVAPR